MKTRNISLDIYRILCMFLITTIHIIGYSNLEKLVPLNHINFYVINIINVLQIFSISGFTLVSAYFLVNQTNTIKKAINFMLQLGFYSITILFLSFIFTSPEISLSLFIKSFFPVASNHYWYTINYLFLLMMAPFLNKTVYALTKKENLILIVVLTVAVSLFFHINPFAEPYYFVGHHTHSLLWFILLYLISAYIRVYGVKNQKVFGIGMFLVCGITLFVLFLIRNNSIINKLDLLSYNSILSLLFTISSFIVFLNLKIPYKKSINSIFLRCIPAVFVIYLIQEHIAVRAKLWSYINITRWSGSLLLAPMIIFVFLGLFLSAFVLHLIYSFCYKLFIKRIEDFVYYMLTKKCFKIFKNWNIK